MITVDTSVLVASFCTWHEFHDEASETAGPDVQIIAHCAAESFSVLTRLPPPHRIAPGDASAWLSRRFTSPWLTLSPEGYANLVADAPGLGIVGGALYDGIVGATAREHDLALKSFDARAARTYRALGLRVG